jgi:glyoxylase-like metal-dependent hydrolase (beta-lactamase superfamily II)
MGTLGEQLAQALLQPPSGAPRKAQLEHPFTPPASDGSVVEVADGVLWARMPMPMALDHINVYLLRGATGWTAVDTGLNTADCRARWEHIARTHLGGLPIEALICTHFHYDHAGLAPWFGEHFKVPLYMTLGEFMTMRVMNAPQPETMTPHAAAFYHAAGMPAGEAAAMFEALRADPFVPPPMPGYRRLRGGQVLAIGARKWRVVIGEGHSPEHACLYCEEDGLLIAGDQLLPGISSNVMVTHLEPDGNPLQGWFDALDRLDACRPDTLVLPSHQNAFRGLHRRTQGLREHHVHEFGVLLACLEQGGGCSAYRAMGVLFPKLRYPVDSMLALGETLAHLAWLRQCGRVAFRLGEDGVGHYSRTAYPVENEEVHW